MQQSLNANEDFYKVLAQMGTNRTGNQAFNMEAVNRAILHQQSYVNNNQIFRDR